MIGKKNFLEVLSIIKKMFPNAHGELHWETPFQLLVATILSAQATDKGVNKATPLLFARFPDVESLAKADLSEVEKYIRTIGLYHTKARNIVKTAQMLLLNYDGKLPRDKEELQKLPGVGRKTGNVVLGEVYGIPGIAVDTHVERICKRFMLVPKKATVREVEDKLMKTIPEQDWIESHHLLIFFGRYHCMAKNPKCENCPVLHYCVFGKKRLAAND